MQRERWVEIEGLLESVLEQPVSARGQFLARACGEDEELRREVEALLKASDDTADFLETPALNLAARTLAAEKESLPGSEIGPYHVLKPLGAGGMGEVFLARDSRLGRNVAIKVLPAEFASDPIRVQRFELEARAASALNHPNVLVVYDIGVHNGLPYIASEYLQGETLRDRLQAGSLGLQRALDFAIQIARALAAAHENGIVHRDLKPENIFVTSEGRIKILDFGLAKLVALPDNSVPTLSMTEPGLIMGSMGYLAPEQIRGQEADRTADIFAFGCVLYEMLTGERAFSKDSSADTLAAILHDQPASLNGRLDLPAALVRAVQHCLEKSPTERFHSARDLAFTLEGCVTPSGAVSSRRVSRVSPPPAWLLAALFAFSTLTLSAIFYLRKPAEAPLLRFEIPIPGDPVTGSPALAISPNGKYVAFLAMGSKGKPIIWTRAMDAIAPRPIPGSEDAHYPFWSADSRFLAFHAADKLKSVDITNGAQRTICSVRGIVNGAWNADGVILLSTGNGPLIRVSPDGNQLTPGTRLNVSLGQRAHWWPSFLPDNRHFLYTVNASNSENSGVFIGDLDQSGTTKLIPGVITNASYGHGYLLYSRDGNLLARPFDPGRRRITGEETAIVEKLKAYYGYTAFSASQNGTLVFRTGDQGRFRLGWFDRTGKQLLPSATSAEMKWTQGLLPLSPMLSPDGSQLATVQYQPTEGTYGIWVSSLTRANIEYPVTITRNAEFPVWSPDGNRLAYSASPNGGARDLFIKRLDEGGVGKLIYHSSGDKWPLDWSSDGRYLLFQMNDQQGAPGLWTINLVDNAPPSNLPGVPADVAEARLSPDGHWIAYTSTQSGSSILFVQDFPKGVSRIPISERGASNPQWLRDGSELFYLSSGDELVSIPIRLTNGLSAGTPRVLFKTTAVGVSPYAVTPDGQRFLIQMPVDNAPVPVISVALNWARTIKP